MTSINHLCLIFYFMKRPSKWFQWEKSLRQKKLQYSLYLKNKANTFQNLFWSILKEVIFSLIYCNLQKYNKSLIKFKSAESINSNSLNLDMANSVLVDKPQTFLITKCWYMTYTSPNLEDWLYTTLIVTYGCFC